MNAPYKRVRYYYWLLSGFLKKNVKVLFINFIIGFFLVLLFISFFPYVIDIINRRTEKIGIVGKFTVSNLPDYIQDELSNPLLIINPKGEIVPILIKSYELLDNNRIYRFYLKTNLTWSNGNAFTAHDISYNLKGVEKKIIDDLTIEFKLNQPLSTFPTYLSKPLFKEKTIGIAGLYELSNYVVKNGVLTDIKLTPNKKNIPIKVYRFYDAEDKLINAYKKGEITLIKTTKKSIADMFSSWKNSRIQQTINYHQILTLFFNTDNKVLSEKENREALIYAIPAFNNYGVAANGPISPLSWAYAIDLKKYYTDIDKASALFKRISEEKKLEINFYTFYEYLSIAEEIKSNFEKIGLKVNLKVLSYLPTDFDLLLTVWNPPSDPDQYYFWHSTQQIGNITRYKNVKIDKLLEDGRKTINIEERKKIYAEFQKNLINDLPAFFIYYPYTYTIEKK